MLCHLGSLASRRAGEDQLVVPVLVERELLHSTGFQLCPVHILLMQHILCVDLLLDQLLFLPPRGLPATQL